MGAVDARIQDRDDDAGRPRGQVPGLGGADHGEVPLAPVLRVVSGHVRREPPVALDELDLGVLQQRLLDRVDAPGRDPHPVDLRPPELLHLQRAVAVVHLLRVGVGHGVVKSDEQLVRRRAVLADGWPLTHRRRGADPQQQHGEGDSEKSQDGVTEHAREPIPRHTSAPSVA